MMMSVSVTIAVELSVEWLWEIREKLLAHEYLVLLATFVAIQITGLNQGLIIGVGLSTLFFVISYASERRCANVVSVHCTVVHALARPKSPLARPRTT